MTAYTRRRAVDHNATTTDDEVCQVIIREFADHFDEVLLDTAIARELVIDHPELAADLLMEVKKRFFRHESGSEGMFLGRDDMSDDSTNVV